MSGDELDDFSRVASAEGAAGRSAKSELDSTIDDAYPRLSAAYASLSREIEAEQTKQRFERQFGRPMKQR